MNENEISDLLDRYLSNECTPEEIAQVESFYAHLALQKTVTVTAEELAVRKQQTFQRFPAPKKVKLYSNYLKYAAAVLIVALCGIGYYTSLHLPKKDTLVDVTTPILPGGNQAILTLANGKQIRLKDTNAGEVANLSGVVVTNLSNGTVTFKGGKTGGNYNLEENGRDGDLNTISVPSGGQYELILPDGSRVYLNAASTLQFPTRFAANSRAVTLTGEAYFEIQKNPKAPFTVSSNGQKLTVLGTHFNVSAYPGETTKTTLTEGSVQLLSSSSSLPTLLKPNQQALLLSTGYEVKTVNASEETAWRNGRFIFIATPLIDVMRQISRWYNVEADLGDLPDDVTISANLPKALSLQSLLNGLQFTTNVKITLTKERRLKFSK